MTISLIWAQSATGVIGTHGTLPWHLPEDLQLFKRLTMGTTVVMGRATWESLPASVRPLPGRRNIVVTGNTRWTGTGAEVAHSLDEALSGAGDVWVIGGASVYAATIDRADRLVVTELEQPFDGDAFAPGIDERWRSAIRDPVEGWNMSRTGLRFAVTTWVRTDSADNAPISSTRAV